MLFMLVCQLLKFEKKKQNKNKFAIQNCYEILVYRQIIPIKIAGIHH